MAEKYTMHGNIQNIIKI